tara:strand:+ start:123 stop:467 length:345 start_codon:yes stop_codon:yes gene_type:complete
MGKKREADPIDIGLHAYSGSIGTFKPARWTSGLRRSFALGDLVTLSPEFRFSIATVSPDFGRYIGVIVEAYSNSEYMVIWTTHPLVVSKFKKGLFNGDHLLLLENAGSSRGDST